MNLINKQQWADQIDIIIPAYHAVNKIKKTIYSYGVEIKYHFIVVVDGDGLNYDGVKTFFDGIQDVDIYYLEKNSGPGIARNYGIEKATRKYITFIDAGDTIYNNNLMENVIKMLYENEDYYLVSCAHYENREGELSLIGPQHNRMHGKFLNRDFINKYNIRFNPNCANMNEDIGFNFAARAIASYLSEKDSTQHILHLTDGLIIWEQDEDSITRQNNYAFYYQKNNEGLAKNAIYAMELLKSNQIDDNYIYDIMYQTIPSLYIFYYSCVFIRPEFIDEMYLGALTFFDYIINNNYTIDYGHLVSYYNMQLKGIYSSNWDPFTMGIPDLTIIQWINKLSNEYQQNIT